MGSQFIAGLKDMDEFTLADMVSMHYSSNCYPPIPQFMLDCGVAAIQACNRGDYDEVIELPHGVTYQGSQFCDAWTFVEQHRLEGFLDDEE